MREILSGRRQSENLDCEWRSMTLQVTVGFYEDGRPGEVFVDTTRKRGSEIDIAARDLGLLISLSLQHGCYLKTIRDGVSPDSLAGTIIGHMIAAEAVRLAPL